MRGRCLTVAMTAMLSLAVLVSPIAAAPDDEIEMEPETGSGSAKPPDPPKKQDKPPAPAPPPVKPPETPAPAPGEIEIDPPPTDPAQPPAATKDPKLAKKVATTAQQAAAKGDQLTRAKKADEAKVQYDAAIVAFLKAIELGDDLNLYFELGVVEDKLGKTAQAATHWRKVVKSPVGTAAGHVRADVHKKAQAKFDEASTKVGTLLLTINPEGTTISLDSVELGKAPLAEPLILMPGNYNFQLAADGHQLKSIEIKIEAGSESERGIDLEPIKVVIDTKPPIDDTPPPPPPRPPSKLPLYIGAGATGGLLLLTTITGIVAVGKHGTFVAPETESFDRELARYDGKNYARVADIALVGTLGAAGFTAYWYFFKYKKAQRKLEAPQKTNVTVVPWVQPDTAGATIGGRF